MTIKIRINFNYGQGWCLLPGSRLPESEKHRNYFFSSLTLRLFLPIIRWHLLFVIGLGHLCKNNSWYHEYNVIKTPWTSVISITLCEVVASSQSAHSPPIVELADGWEKLIIRSARLVWFDPCLITLKQEQLFTISSILSSSRPYSAYSHPATNYSPTCPPTLQRSPACLLLYLYILYTHLLFIISCLPFVLLPAHLQRPVAPLPVSG
jgi:hypothetical protein